MGLTQSDTAEKDDIGFGFYKLKAKKVLHLKAVDVFGPGPAELIQGFNDREAGHLNAALDGAVLADGRSPSTSFAR